MKTRRQLVEFFGAYADPTINITTEVVWPDYLSRARAAKAPSFAWLLYAIATASLEVENFRWRIVDGRLEEVTSLMPSYAVRDANDNLNFSTIRYTGRREEFVARYIEDREAAQKATSLRLVDMTTRNFIFVTCLPFMRFTAIDHPTAHFSDASIPHVAIGQARPAGDGVSLPVAVQAHHGLVDALHIAQFLEAVRDGLSG